MGRGVRISYLKQSPYRKKIVLRPEVGKGFKFEENVASSENAFEWTTLISYRTLLHFDKDSENTFLNGHIAARFVSLVAFTTKEPSFNISTKAYFTIPAQK